MIPVLYLQLFPRKHPAPRPPSGCPSCSVPASLTCLSAIAVQPPFSAQRVPAVSDAAKLPALLKPGQAAKSLDSVMPRVRVMSCWQRCPSERIQVAALLPVLPTQCAAGAVQCALPVPPVRAGLLSTNPAPSSVAHLVNWFASASLVRRPSSSGSRLFWCL
jgi:hypothetical protein